MSIGILSTTSSTPHNAKTNTILKILHVIIGLGAGGAEHMLLRLVESHRGNCEFCHSVVSLTDSGDLGDAFASAGVEVRVLRMRRFNSPMTAVRLAKVIREKQPDVIQTWMYHADLIGGLAARAVGNRHVIWGIRNTDMIRGTAYSTFAIRRVCAILSHRVPNVIVCAAEASRKSHAAIGYDKSKMIVISNGFEISLDPTDRVNRPAIRTELGWSNTEIVIGCVGRFNFYKDHANFVRAAAILAQRFSTVRFLMIGKGLDNANVGLKSLVASTGCAQSFRLLGFRSDVAMYLSAMDVFCLSSRSEGFPNVIGEAMCVGIPCVATDTGDARILIGDTGIVVPKENSAALADGLAQIVSMSPNDREAMGQRARKRIVDNFSMDIARERFESVYRSIVAPPDRAIN